MKFSTDVNELFSALTKCRFESIKKTDSAHRHKFANINSVLDVVLPELAKHCLAISQWPTDLDGDHALTTMLIHESGQYMSSTIKLMFDKSDSDPQQLGSSLTYTRRYAVLAALSLSTVDDDGSYAKQKQERTLISKDQLTVLKGRLGSNKDKEAKLLEVCKRDSLEELSDKQYSFIIARNLA